MDIKVSIEIIEEFGNGPLFQNGISEVRGLLQDPTSNDLEQVITVIRQALLASGFLEATIDQYIRGVEI